MNRKVVVVLLLAGLLVGDVNALTFSGSVLYFSEIGGGQILFDTSFTADSITWSSDFLRFTNWDMGEAFSDIGFKNPNAGTTMTLNSATHDQIRYTVAGGVGALTYSIYLPTVPSVTVLTGAGVTSAIWNGGTKIISVTQDTYPLQVIIQLNWGGGGGGGTEPTPTPTPTPIPVTVVDYSGGGGWEEVIVEALPEPVQQIVVNLTPWWHKHGTWVIVGAVLAVFAIYLIRPKNRRSDPLDYVLNPEKYL